MKLVDGEEVIGDQGVSRWRYEIERDGELNVCIYGNIWRCVVNASCGEF